MKTQKINRVQQREIVGGGNQGCLTSFKYRLSKQIYKYIGDKMPTMNTLAKRRLMVDG